MMNWSTPNDSGDERRRSRAAEMPEVPALDAHGLGLVVEIVLDAGDRQDDDPGGQGLQHRIVALERSGLLLQVPVRLERDLRDLWTIGPEARDFPDAAARVGLHRG